MDTDRKVITQDMKDWLNISEVKAKTFCQDFDEQLDLAEQLYGGHLHFYYTEKEIDRLLDEEPYYPEETKQRVKMILMHQKRKYQYLFIEPEI